LRGSGSVPFCADDSQSTSLQHVRQQQSVRWGGHRIRAECPREHGAACDGCTSRRPTDSVNPRVGLVAPGRRRRGVAVRADSRLRRQTGAPAPRAVNRRDHAVPFRELHRLRASASRARRRFASSSPGHAARSALPCAPVSSGSHRAARRPGAGSHEPAPTRPRGAFARRSRVSRNRVSRQLGPFDELSPSAPRAISARQQ